MHNGLGSPSQSLDYDIPALAGVEISRHLAPHIFEPIPRAVWEDLREFQNSDYGYGGHRIYDGRYSYIVFTERGTEELYDHEKDPMEWNNLVDNPEYAGIKKRLKALIPTTREKESPRNRKG